MTDFIPQKTDQLPGNTSPYNVNIQAFSSAVLPLTLGGSWWSGTVDVEFPQYNNQYANLEIEAWLRFQLSGGGNTIAYYKLPLCITNSTGTVGSSGFIRIMQPAKSGIYTVTFGFGTSSTPLIDPTVYYKLRNDRISASGLTFV